MTKRRFSFTFFLLICFSLPLTATAQTVNIPDPNLRLMIEIQLGKARGDVITTGDMADLTFLIAGNANIRNLTGLEHAINLISLYLGVHPETGNNSNSIQDISPLAGLNKLERLWLERNNISDISPLAGLDNLEWLELWLNQISDISDLAALNNLKRLKLGGNEISNISPLAGLDNLEWLELWLNQISDISDLAALNNLEWLDLGGNEISNISPLAGLNNLKRLELWSNQISDISDLAGLDNLIYLNLGGNFIPDISALSRLTDLTILILDGNLIADISPLVENTGLRNDDIVSVTENPLNAAAINTHIPTLQRRGVDVRFDAVMAEPVDIPDTNLRAAIERALGKASGATITTADMANLTRLVAPNANINDLSGLEHATNLEVLHFGLAQVAPGVSVNSNSISDISPLARLTNLQALNLEGNSISNISPLAGLTNLQVLLLSGNSISNISPVAGLTNLTGLFLGGNSISDVSPIEGLANLTHLFLDYNSISDISPLAANTGLGRGDRVLLQGNPLNAASLNTHIPTLQRRGVTVEVDPVIAEPVDIPDPNLRAAIEAELGKTSGDTITTTDMANLTRLVAPNANISNLTGLEGATNLRMLNLGGVDMEGEGWINSNSISDLSPLVDLADLETLRLDRNSISDISPLAGLTNLDALLLHNNSISDISPLERLNQLTQLWLDHNSISDISSLEGLNQLTDLSLWNNSISDISSLGGLNQLESLLLDQNSISDVSPLQGLNNLTQLGLSGNNISNISPLEDLTNLETLLLQYNSISDISPLQGLNNLTFLGLGNNSISDLLPLEELNNMEALGLMDNSISDISPLGGLNNLIQLELSGNNISDISPLVANTGLGSGDTVNVSENPLSSASLNTHIPTLQRRGVTVEFDAVIAEPVVIPDPNLRAAIEAELGKASGATITTVDMANLNYLEAPNANISNLTGLEHATNLRVLSLGAAFVFSEGNFLTINSNSTSDISPLAGLTNLETLRLDHNSIFDISPLAELTNLKTLLLHNNSISNISPLERLNDLTQLWLAHNSISDISPLAGLTNLEDLELHNNSISDISPLKGLNNLTDLRLGNNSISDISPLQGLNQLTKLWLSPNNISDISPLKGLNQLTDLSLWNNSISDISPLVANSGLGSGDKVSVNGNPLNAASINTHIPALQSRGVTVEFDAVITEPVEIPDPNLRAAIEAELDIAQGAVIATLDMAGLNSLVAKDADISDLTGLEHATNLTRLELGGEYVAAEERWINSNSISDISPLARLNNLEWLSLWGNSISDISRLEGLTNLTGLALSSNLISDISSLVGLTNLTELYLADNSISDISPLERLNNLTALWLWGNSISDLSPLEGLTNLTDLDLWNNSISDLSPLEGLTNLTGLRLGSNSISDISPLEGLNNLTRLFLQENSISDISPLKGLNNLTELYLADNSISDISPLERLNNLTVLWLRDNSISDLSSLVENMGLGEEDWVGVSENPLNFASINTHIPALQSRRVTVEAEDLKPTTSEYTLSIPAGISLIHVPLKVTAVDDMEQTIESVGDLYDTLGGTGIVNFLITYDSMSQEWRSYFVPSDKGGPADSGLTDDTGIIVGLRTPVSVHLRGTALGTDGNSTITLKQGLNVVGLPLDDSRIERVSDLFTLDGIGGNVPVIILTDSGEFKLVGRAGDPGDIPITGGQAFILTAQRATTVPISGDAWANGSGTAAAPPVTRKGVEVGDTTPVLGLRGAIVDEGTRFNNAGFRVTVKNLSTGRAVTTVTTPDEAGYRSTVVDIETGRAATVGDILEISARSPNPFIGVEPLRYTITAEDVKQSLIQLPNLFAYEIPAETQLLSNYPNPFNPETWIPYRLAEDAFVTLTIYDGMGQIVRTIDVGHQIAAVYESQSKAIYWDGRNKSGEPVASGVYFYHLSAGEFSATRKMLILK